MDRLRAGVFRGLVLLAALATAASAQDPGAEKKKEAPTELEENLFTFEPLRLNAEKLDQRVEIVLHRWLEVDREQTFQLMLQGKPAFVKKAEWESDRVVFGPEDEKKEVVLRFRLADSGRGEGDFTIVIRAEDETIVPRERRYVLPVSFGRAENAVHAFALVADAPSRIEPKELHNYIDRSGPPTVHDRIAIFFTPARDIWREKLEFYWYLVGPDGEKYGSGLYTHEEKEKSYVDRAGPGAPALFATIALPSRRTRDKSPPAGEWVFQTAPETWGGISLLGIPVRQAGEPQDEGTIKLDSPVLHHEGFVFERGGDLPVGGYDFCAEGTLMFPNALPTGTGVTVRGEAVWRKGERRRIDGKSRWVAVNPQHRARSTLRLDFPETIDPGAKELATVKVDLRLEEKGEAHSGMVLHFIGAMRPLTPVSGQPPGRETIKLGGHGYLDYDQGVADHVKSRGEFPKPNYKGDMRLKVAFRSPCGTPKRDFAAHLRDPETVWYIPFRISFLLRPHNNRFSSTIDRWGFAVYRAKPGAGVGPGPESRPEGREGDAVEDGGPGTAQPGGDRPPGDTTVRDDDRAGDESEGERGDASGERGDGSGERGDGTDRDAGSAGGGRTGPVDPARLDPNDPDIARHIRTWLRIAEPPQNATIGANLKYNEWGVMIGTVPTGRIIPTPGKPDDVGARKSEEYVWSLRTKLDSVDHCTLEEYVVAQLEGKGIGHCRARYRPAPTVRVPSLVGMTRAAADRRLSVNGLKPRFLPGRSAPSKAKEGTVASQKPAASTELKPGDTVSVRLFTRHIREVAVPRLTGRPLPEARATLERAGLEVEVVRGTPAATAREAGVVYRQDPAGGTRLREGDKVRLTAHAPPAPRAPQRPFFVVCHFAFPETDKQRPKDMKIKDWYRQLRPSDFTIRKQKNAILLLTITGPGLSFYSRDRFGAGKRFAYRFRVQGTERDGKKVDLKGALYFEALATYDSLEDAIAAHVQLKSNYESKDYEKLEKLFRFDKADGAGGGEIVGDKGERGRFTLSPIVDGWPEELKRESIDMIRIYAEQNDCFLATATYGTTDNRQLRAFRRFRDEVLEKSAAGRRLVAAYYRLGPPVAARLRGRGAAELRPRFDRLAAWLEDLDLNDARTRAWLDLHVRVLDRVVALYGRVSDGFAMPFDPTWLLDPPGR